MNLKFQMIDTDTGEILAHKYHNFVCSFCTKNDAGFTRIMEWAQSCVKGVRCSEHKSIELRIGFCEDRDPEYIPFNDLDLAKEKAAEYVY